MEKSINESVGRLFLRYMLNNVAGMIGLSCYILVDTFFISKAMGSQGLAALNLAIPFFSFNTGVGLMLGMGGGTLYSISRGKGKEEKANQVFTTTMIMATFVFLVMMIAGFTLPEQMIGLFGAGKQVSAMGSLYLKVILLFAPAFILNNVLLCFVRNDGGPGIGMTAMLSGSFLNIVLDYVFMFPLHMGMMGAALATSIAPIVSLLVLSVFIIRKKNHFKFRASAIKEKRKTFHYALNIIISGIPSLIGELSSAVIMVVFNLLILKYSGEIGVAAYGIIANIALVIMAIFTGIGQGVQPLMSRCYGQGNYQALSKLLKYALTAELLIATLVVLSTELCAEPLTAVFNEQGNVELAAIAVTGIKIYFPGAIFAGINIIMPTYFTSVEKPLLGQIIAVLRGFVLVVPLAFILADMGGMRGIWSVFPITELIVCIICGVIFYREKSRKLR